ncbi:hypothetical protein Poli38472_008361 [Pythium oligandrum]|uniref:Uncharacterized protein n=1 Tax=Pythium oligandrum TaxID=41045 RepID=A0A8K1CMC4_PYTOL|nr:hypothetical protein Poli38472_008361 [Pythium oligandrum]|eukprot:TMW65719.1 hypothetical protein Poli38472_008361 [Pythium oligandrum]
MAPSTEAQEQQRVQLQHKLTQRLALLGCSVLDAVGETDGSPLTSRQCAQIIMWLEDRVIRHDSIDARSGMREALSPQKWLLISSEYLERQGCPLKTPEKEMADSGAWGSFIGLDMYRVLLWLASHTISLEYEEHADRIKADLRAKEHTEAQQPSRIHPVDNIACSEELWTAFQEMQKASHGADTLRDHVQVEDKGDECDNDPERKADMENAVMKLRQAYIDDMKALQLDINRLIARAQEYTANPKTDASLGRTSS